MNKEVTMKVLLLGSTGQVGTAIESHCKKKGIECLGLSRENIEITHPEEVESAIENYCPDVVINSVALQAIDKCVLHAAEAFEINSIAVSHLARICDKKDITLMQLSTHTIFDGTKNDYYTEDDGANPINIYGASKYLGEIFARNLCKKHYIVRIPVVFGSRRAGYYGFVDKVLQWIDEGRELKMTDNNTESFCYNLDVADSLICILLKKMPFGVYHVTNFGKASMYEFVSKIVEIMGVHSRVHRAKDKDFKALGKRPLHTAIKSIKLDPLRAWEDSLSEYIINEVKDNKK